MSSDWTAFPVGIAIATMATMVGLGGGIIWTPYLIFVARLEPTVAVATSLIIQVVGMGSGGAAALRKKKTDPRFALVLAACAVPGLGFGVWLSGYISAHSIEFLLGIVSLVTALVFVYAREDLDAKPVRNVSIRSAVPYLWLSPTFSVLTGLLSVGAGDFLVPVLRNRLGMKMDSAVGTCLIVMAMNALVATCLHLAMGERPSWGLIVWAAPGVLLGGQIGPRLAGRIPDQTLKEVFIYGLSLVGIHIMFNACGAR